MKTISCLSLAAVVIFAACHGLVAAPPLVHDADAKLVTLSDAAGNLTLRLNYNGRCMLDSVIVHGREVLAKHAGAAGGIALGGRWFTSRDDGPTPKVALDGNSVTVSGIRFGGNGVEVEETWTFTVRDDRILWRIEREYLGEGVLDDSSLPGWHFANIATWSGGFLGTGGVVWPRLLLEPTATYGVHTGKVVFWNSGDGSALRIEAEPDAGRHHAVRFSRNPDGTLTASFSATEQELRPKHSLARFVAGHDVWRPFAVKPGKIGVSYTLQAIDYDKTYNRGKFVGLPGETIRELLNTIGRYGVVDARFTGTNGWRSNGAALHEQWIAQLGLAVNDPDYIANVAATLDHWRDHAIGDDGRVKSRIAHYDGDAMPGTWNPETGYYEAIWGYLLDSQPGYVICVAEQFDLNGDMDWVRGHRRTCRLALDYMLRRDADGDGLLEAHTQSHKEARGSDWIDVVWASHENALLNAEMYAALNLWADVEQALGDAPQAEAYRRAAAKLKAAFNRPVAEGGFWNPDRGWYVYWLDADGSAHGDNLTTPVNFCAIAYGLCDDPSRAKALLNEIESRMRREKLFHWPLCFESFARDEAYEPINWPFPNYENGDIFLGWGEVGVRAYAAFDPAVAVKYVKNVLDRYERDGLAFQRYRRQSQTGAGGDILANNAMTIVGLYRDIYGVRPKYNRLCLTPRLTPELHGTRLRYWLRGAWHSIELDADGFSVAVGDRTLRATKPCGVNFTDGGIEYFPGCEAVCGLAVARTTPGPLELRVEAWPDAPRDPRRWTVIASPAGGVLRHVVAHLTPNAVYKLSSNGEAVDKLRADAAGKVEFASPHNEATPKRFELSLDTGGK
jgi:hypothetical protein